MAIEEGTETHFILFTQEYVRRSQIRIVPSLQPITRYLVKLYQNIGDDILVQY